MSDELYQVASVLGGHIELRRHLVDPTGTASLRRSLVENLFSSKLDATTVELLTALVQTRLSTPTDLVEAVETLGRTAALAAAEKDGTLSDTEDDLFRFGRILQREPQLRTLLADTTAPTDKRVELLSQVLGDKVTPTARRLLEQSVRHPYSKALDYAAERLADAAAARRDRSIARVVAPIALSEEQEDTAGRRAVPPVRTVDLGAVRRRPGHPGWPGRAGRRRAARRQRRPPSARCGRRLPDVSAARSGPGSPPGPGGLPHPPDHQQS